MRWSGLRIMKKICIMIICMITVLVTDYSVYSYADSASGAYLINAVTGESVFEKNGDVCLPMASTTKIMTLITALEMGNTDDMVSISQNAAGQEGSSAYIAAGAKMSMKDLMYGLMLNSGNDAAVAIAEHISGSTDKFAQEMTKLAKSIGAENTRFANPNGLDAEGHYTTAHDLALITAYAMKNEQFREIVSARSYTASMEIGGKIKQVEYINHNKLLSSYDGCIGVKTGYTKADGRCLVSAAERDGATYIAVTLNCKNDWQEHREMLDYAFSRTRMITAVEQGECFRHIVSGNESCEIVASEKFDIPVTGEKGRNITVKTNISAVPPLNKGEKAGELDIYYGGELIGTVDAIAADDIGGEEKINIKPCFLTTVKRLLKNILG